MPLIRPFVSTDWPMLWPLLQATSASEDTYAFEPSSSESDIHRAWIEVPTATFVACSGDGCIAGTYFIKPNQPGLDAHVCNCGYVTDALVMFKSLSASPTRA
jgi:hypothetical protein